MLKLLVVEDHALVREGLAQTLRLLGPDVMVLEAADCDSANRLLQGSGSVDLMLLDLGLPRLDGLSYLSTLRKRHPAMPVVILSAFDDATTVSKAINRVPPDLSRKAIQAIACWKSCVRFSMGGDFLQRA